MTGHRFNRRKIAGNTAFMKLSLRWMAELLLKRSAIIAVMLLFLLQGVGLIAQTLGLNSNGTAVHLGDLDVPGNQITIEAMIYLEQNTPAGNVVSKHRNPSDVNYLLRPASFELSTYQHGNAGAVKYMLVKNPVKIEMNRWYHIAGTYDGARIKFYLDGCLVMDSAFSGNLCQNNYTTSIGNRMDCGCEQFFGKLDEVRIWRTARTRKEIVANMMSLSEPAAQPGLLAYYKFNGNYKNSQGNTSWNGSTAGTPAFLPADAFVQGFDITGIQTYNADCDKVNNGGINLLANSTHALYSIDGTHFQTNGSFPTLLPGSYNVYVSDREGCVLKDKAVVGNNHQFAAMSVSASLCRETNFAGHTSAGTYVDTIVSSSGCDTLRTVILSENLRSMVNVSKSICEGESYEMHQTSGIYADTLVAANGCDSIRVLKLTVMAKPHPELGQGRQLCKGDTVRLFPGDYPSYLWQDGSSADHYTVTRPGIYSVKVSNACGVKDQQVQIVDGVCGLFFPTAFTPNNDGRNDAFRPTAYNLPNFQWKIYNRFAQLVFETKEDRKGWDGRVNGQLQSAGVYVWTCSYTLNSKPEVKKGSFVLIR